MTVSLQVAVAADTEFLIGSMRLLWKADPAHFSEARARLGLATLLDNDHFGRAWVILSGGVPAGYLILTFGFSLEFGGRDAFIDEFFIGAAYRGRGLGGHVLDLVSSEAAALGVKALHLEVADTNDKAEALYGRKGFERHNRRLMTRWL